MKSLSYILLITAVLTLLPGCGGSKDSGVNRHKDLPRAAPSQKNK